MKRGQPVTTPKGCGIVEALHFGHDVEPGVYVGTVLVNLGAKLDWFLASEVRAI